MERAKAKREGAMSSGMQRNQVKRSRSERPYLRPVRSVPPARPRKRRPPRAVAHPVSVDVRRFDPLDRDAGGGARRAGRAAGYWLLAAMVHGLIVSVLIYLGGDPGQLNLAPPAENVFVEIKTPEVPPPPPPPEPAPVDTPPEVAPAPEEKVVKQVETKTPEPRKQRPQPTEQAVADPVDMNQAPPEAGPRRKVVGINFESTVTGGNGPAFAVGNSRMGETGTRAGDATNLAPLPKGRSKGHAVSANRVATAIPSAGISLVKPQRRANVEPEYPGQLKAQGIEGNVVVLIRIDANGRVNSVKVVKGSGYAAFDAEATKAARKERFSPALRNGEPIEYTLKYTYRFRVREG